MGMRIQRILRLERIAAKTMGCARKILHEQGILVTLVDNTCQIVSRVKLAIKEKYFVVSGT
jgi:hypothetical protein